MEPLSVFRTIWRQRWLAIPAIILTVVAAGLVTLYGPREYEASISYAIVDPQQPTQDEIELNPALKLLNSDNPYLRSSDPNLIANVLITRLNAERTQDEMKRRGLSPSYEAAPGQGQGLIVTITASAESPRTSITTVETLGGILQTDLRTIQKVNGADDRYLFTSIVIDRPYKATEKLSSRLRTVIIVAIAGVIFVFGAVSLGNAIERGRRRRRERIEAARLDAERIEWERQEAEEAGRPATEDAAPSAALDATATAGAARKPRRPAQHRPKRATPAPARMSKGSTDGIADARSASE